MAGKFREAHANYNKVQAELDGQEVFKGVYLTDLMKAFE